MERCLLPLALLRLFPCGTSCTCWLFVQRIKENRTNQVCRPRVPLPTSCQGLDWSGRLSIQQSLPCRIPAAAGLWRRLRAASPLGGGAWLEGVVPGGRGWPRGAVHGSVVWPEGAFPGPWPVWMGLGRGLKGAFPGAWPGRAHLGLSLLPSLSASCPLCPGQLLSARSLCHAAQFWSRDVEPQGASPPLSYRCWAFWPSIQESDSGRM